MKPFIRNLALNLWLFLIMPNLLVSQELSLSETVTYINSKLNTPYRGYAGFKQSYNLQFSSQACMFKLECITTRPIDNSYKGGKLIYTYEFRPDEVEITFIKPKGMSGPIISISCPNFCSKKTTDSEFPSNNESGTSAYISIEYNDDVLLHERVYNAFVHLQNIYESQPCYKPFQSSDPFDNRSSVISQKTIPLIQNRDLTYSVRVKIGRGEYLFILDSGAADVLISKNVFTDLISNGTLTYESFISNREYINANGIVTSMPVYRLSSLQIGQYEIKNIECAVSKSTENIMLLGQSVLSRLGKISIDYKKHCIIIN